MKAISLLRPGQLEITVISEPELGPEEVLVQIHCIGLCGSDLTAYRGLSPW